VAAKKKTTTKKAAKRAVPSVSPARGKTVDWYLEKLPAWQRAFADEIVAVVKRAVPTSTASIKWAQPVWDSGGPLAWLRGAREHLSFGFWRGADLDDPRGLLEGDGDRMRHLKLTEGSKLPRKDLERLVRQAAALNAEKGDPTKRAR
jgi:hypothetical protein